VTTQPPPVRIRGLADHGDLTGLHAAHPTRYPHLLESLLQGSDQGRYDILFAFPGERLVLDRGGTLTGGPAGASGFIDGLTRAFDRHCSGPQPTPLPFHGGWFLYLGYELAAEIEPRLRLPPPDMDFPTALAERFPAAIIRDHARRRTYLMAEPGAEALLDVMEDDIDAFAGRSAPDSGASLIDGPLEEDPPAPYLRAIEQIKRYIVAGDVFQVNLARRWRARVRPGTRHVALYRRLRRSNPGPFAGLATWAERAIVSSSPERLVAVRDGIVQTRPIAGTHPRGGDEAADEDLSRKLIASPKERAEHVMLIDLERNDLGRVSAPGSVRVDEFMVVESYAHVHHIVSNIRGRLRPGTGPGEVIRAVFPGGTITGCPKIRCMEIIAELEGRGRGPYTGAMGYLNRDGSLDLNILIRSLVRAGSRLDFHAGAGIVADSRPARELAETRSKAEGLIRALSPRSTLV
jgi:anthranilate synthase component 1